MPNFDGLYELRFKYEVVVGSVVLSHVHTIDVNLDDANPSPGELFTAIQPTFTGANLGMLDDVVEAYLDAITTFWTDDMTVNTVELWKIPEGTFTGQFISAYTPTNNVGTNVGSTVVAGQMTMTLRSFGGGIMRLQFMETAYNDPRRLAYPTGVAGVDAVFADLVDDSTAFLARDNTPPLAPIALLGGQNEKIFRKRYRTS